MAPCGRSLRIRPLRLERLEQRSLLSLTPLGDEFRANTETTGDQMTSFDSPESVAVDGEGGFVVTWTDFEHDGGRGDIFVRKYAADGEPISPPVLVNQEQASRQSRAVVAVDEDGDFVVAWASQGQDGSGYGIFARRYNAAAKPVSDEFQVNRVTFSNQNRPSVAMDADGDFIVAWASDRQDGASYGIVAQRFRASGERQGEEFIVNGRRSGGQSFPSVAMDDEGKFIVVWVSHGQDGSAGGIFAQQYDAQGEKFGTEFRINNITEGAQIFPVVDMDSRGNFVIAWSSIGGDTQEIGNSRDIMARAFLANRVTRVPEFRIQPTSGNNDILPDVALAENGSFIVTWSSFEKDGDGWGVFAQKVDMHGDPQGGPQLVNERTLGNQQSSSVAVGPGGSVVLVWTGERVGRPADDVYVRRYLDNVGPLAVIGSELLSMHEGETLLLDARKSFDPNGSAGDAIAAYRWDLNGDGVFDVNTPEPLTQLSWEQLAKFGIVDGPAAWQVTLQVADTLGAVSTDRATLFVENTAPSIDLGGANLVFLGTTYELLLGKISEPGRDNVTRWIVDWGDGGKPETFDSGGIQNHRYQSTGTYTILVTLVDEDGTHENVGQLNVSVIRFIIDFFDFPAGAPLSEWDQLFSLAWATPSNSGLA